MGNRNVIPENPAEEKPAKQPLNVVAAVVRRGDSILVCRRPEGKARANQWEFPGGKIEPGETESEALVRECREELGFTVRPEKTLTEVVYEYPDVTVRLIAILCCAAEGEPTALEHSEIRFVPPAELASLDLCPADRIIAVMLR
jgi:ADP-ribose pyrophosphatase